MRDILYYSSRIGILLLICTLIGCGTDGDESPQPDAGTRVDGGPDSTSETGPDAPADSTAPDFRDVRISVGGEASAEIDLGDEDDSQILPTTAPAAFKLFVRDDTTATEELVVEIVDGQGEPLTPVDGPTFRNGLWHVEVEIGPGVSVRPKVTDAAGNGATYGAALVIPTRAEATVDQWRTLFYDAEFEVAERWLSKFEADGTWVQSQDVDGGWSQGGTFEFDQDTLVLTETYSPDDDDETSAEWREEGAYYIDEVYFARQPLHRQGDGDGLVGTWSYEYERFEANDATLESQGTYTVSLTFDDDATWQETTGATDVGLGQTRSGTWEVETNAGYAANFGDFLIRTTTHENGEALQTPVETIDLFVLRLDNLLISPRIRGHSQ